MSGIGGWEVIILVMIGLIVLGPKRLPQVANQLGSWIGQARRMTRTLKRQLEDELDIDGNFNIKSPRIAPPVVADSDDPASPDYDFDDSEPHIPADGDTYSPIHDAEDEAEDEADDDSTEHADTQPEKNA